MARAPASRRRSSCRRRRPTRTTRGAGRRSCWPSRGRARHPPARPALVRRHPHRHRTQRDARQRRRAPGPARARRAVGRGVRGDARFRRARWASASRRWSRWAARIDVGFGELLDALLVDPHTDGILLYAETVGDRAAFPVGAARGGADEARRRAEGRAVDGARRRRCAVARCRVRRGDEARRHGAREDLCAAVRRGADPGDEPDRRAATGSRSSPTGTGRERSPPTAPRDRGIALAELLAGDGEGAVGTAAAEHRLRAIRSTSAATPRRRGSRRRSRRRSPIRRSTPCSRCTCRGRSPEPPTRRARSRPSRGARRSPCWARGSVPIDRARGDRCARGGRHRQLLHARERGRGVLVPRRVSPPSGVAARGAAAAARAAAAGSRPRSSAFAPTRHPPSARVLTEMETHALLSAFGLPVAPAESADTLDRSAGGGAAPRLSR